jgi:dolichol-phosphate mannosyltransferase
VGISIIVPTYQEIENLPILISQIAQLKKQLDPLELIIVDDDSKDGTDEYIAELQYNWIKLISRKNKRGLSTAVLAGFAQASYPILICMDGDLSHPVSVIPEMVKTIQQNDVDFVVGSRFMQGSDIDASWPMLRKLNAAVAKCLARFFTSISDPMSGFFCLKKSTFLTCGKLNPVGYKIGLELIVKCRCKNIVEIPIHFSDRLHGKSKLNWREMFNYLLHLIKLFKYKYGTRVS